MFESDPGSLRGNGLLTNSGGESSRAAALPWLLAPLVGRDTERKTLRVLVADQATRLVTLTGPGGVGKTRLAIEAARAAASDFPGGVAFVDLSPLRDPDLVIPTVVRGLGLRSTGDEQSLDFLVESLRDERHLLVLDNFEQIVGAAPRVASLLRRCPGLVVLVTSRIALHISGERLLPVQPLSVPNIEKDISPESIACNDAVSLFIQRAREIRAEFALTDENAAAVAAVCASVDGLPLAIELAAARARVLSPHQILERLHDRLPLLSSAARDAPERQRTLRNTIAWSYDLLTASERAAFRALAVFSGGCSLELAGKVMGDRPRDLFEQLDVLTALVNHSLVREAASTDSEPRFTMLETIRAFGVEALVEQNEEHEIRNRHARAMFDMVVWIEPQLTGPDQTQRLLQLEQEHDNVREALAWLIEHDPAIATQMTGALWRFWWTHGHLTEGRRWLTAALESGAGTTTNRARALYGLGSLAGEQGDYPEASVALLDSLALFREADDRAGQALALTDLGLIARDQSDLASAANRHNEALELRRELDDRRGIAISLSNLGIVAMNGGDFAAAESAFADAVRVFRELGDARSLATAVSTQADAAQRQGHFERAIALGTESVGLLTEVGDRAAAAVSLVTLADCHRALGQTKSAIASYDAALEHFRSLGHRRGLAATLTVRAALAMDMGQLPLAIGLIAEGLDLLGANGDRFIRLNSLECLARAAHLADFHDAATRLLSAVETQRSLLGVPRSPIREADRRALRADLIATLGRSRFDALWHSGSHVTWDELLRSADALVHKLGTTSPPRAPAAAPNPELALDLTPRQIVVLTLIAEGCTNQQIADRLGITLLTAKTHVSRVLTNLDLPSRSAAAAVARRHGLI